MTAPEKVTGVELTDAAVSKTNSLLAQEGFHPGSARWLRWPALPAVLR